MMIIGSRRIGVITSQLEEEEEEEELILISNKYWRDLNGKQWIFKVEYFINY